MNGAGEALKQVVAICDHLWQKVRRMIESHSIILLERIERSILLIRGERDMLDSDLAEIYGVETKWLNEQVQRNLNRFPTDFMFQLKADQFLMFLNGLFAPSAVSLARSLAAKAIRSSGLVGTSTLNGFLAMFVFVLLLLIPKPPNRQVSAKQK
jgi:hypothetical protein